MRQYQKPLVAKSVFSLALSAMMIATSCGTSTEKSTGQIFLYGEAHGNERIMDRQLEIWREHYHNQGMRHLFIEFTFPTAEFLNMWMQSDNDDILYELFDDWAGTSVDIPHTLVFFRTIKSEFPETIFHGVNVAHWEFPAGMRLLQYLEDNNMQSTERYFLTLKSLEQGEQNLQGGFDRRHRVNAMTENFIREFDRLGGRSVMGIFGAAHARFGFAQGLPGVPTMAQRLRKRYGRRSVHTEDLTSVALLIDPIRTDIVSINGVNYEASYFGTDLTAFRDIVSRSFWRIEDAYDDFRRKPMTHDRNILPYDNYPMMVRPRQVFIVDAAYTDGSTRRAFYRSDRGFWRLMSWTVEFIVD